ncbi:hypothetical protein HDU96_005412 [Phlyctochytrium bullatum]|nr:hypothetical protein HDU96_005412 [Phlyctochytrium bullatum]
MDGQDIHHLNHLQQRRGRWGEHRTRRRRRSDLDHDSNDDINHHDVAFASAGPRHFLLSSTTNHLHQQTQQLASDNDIALPSPPYSPPLWHPVSGNDSVDNHLRRGFFGRQQDALRGRQRRFFGYNNRRHSARGQMMQPQAAAAARVADHHPVVSTDEENDLMRQGPLAANDIEDNPMDLSDESFDSTSTSDDDDAHPPPPRHVNPTWSTYGPPTSSAASIHSVSSSKLRSFYYTAAQAAAAFAASRSPPESPPPSPRRKRPRNLRLSVDTRTPSPPALVSPDEFEHDPRHGFQAFTTDTDDAGFTSTDASETTPFSPSDDEDRASSSPAASPSPPRQVRLPWHRDAGDLGRKAYGVVPTPDSLPSQQLRHAVSLSDAGEMASGEDDIGAATMLGLHHPSPYRMPSTSDLGSASGGEDPPYTGVSPLHPFHPHHAAAAASDDGGPVSDPGEMASGEDAGFRSTDYYATTSGDEAWGRADDGPQRRFSASSGSASDAYQHPPRRTPALRFEYRQQLRAPSPSPTSPAAPVLPDDDPAAETTTTGDPQAHAAPPSPPRDPGDTPAAWTLPDDDPLLLELIGITARKAAQAAGAPIPPPGPTPAPAAPHPEEDTPASSPALSASSLLVGTPPPSPTLGPHPSATAAALPPPPPATTSAATSFRASRCKAYIEARYNQLAHLQALRDRGARTRRDGRRVRYNPLAVVRWRREVWQRSVRGAAVATGAKGESGRAGATGRWARRAGTWSPAAVGVAAGERKGVAALFAGRGNGAPVAGAGGLAPGVGGLRLGFWHVTNAELAEWVVDAVVVPHEETAVASATAVENEGAKSAPTTPPKPRTFSLHRAALVPAAAAAAAAAAEPLKRKPSSLLLRPLSMARRNRSSEGGATVVSSGASSGGSSVGVAPASPTAAEPAAVWGAPDLAAVAAAAAAAPVVGMAFLPVGRRKKEEGRGAEKGEEKGEQEKTVEAAAPSMFDLFLMGALAAENVEGGKKNEVVVAAEDEEVASSTQVVTAVVGDTVSETTFVPAPVADEKEEPEGAGEPAVEMDSAELVAGDAAAVEMQVESVEPETPATPVQPPVQALPPPFMSNAALVTLVASEMGASSASPSGSPKRPVEGELGPEARKGSGTTGSATLEVRQPSLKKSSLTSSSSGRSAVSMAAGGELAVPMAASPSPTPSSDLHPTPSPLADPPPPPPSPPQQPPALPPPSPPQQPPVLPPRKSSVPTTPVRILPVGPVPPLVAFNAVVAVPPPLGIVHPDPAAAPSTNPATGSPPAPKTNVMDAMLGKVAGAATLRRRLRKEREAAAWAAAKAGEKDGVPHPGKRLAADLDLVAMPPSFAASRAPGDRFPPPLVKGPRRASTVGVAAGARRDGGGERGSEGSSATAVEGGGDEGHLRRRRTIRDNLVAEVFRRQGRGRKGDVDGVPVRNASSRTANAVLGDEESAVSDGGGGGRGSPRRKVGAFEAVAVKRITAEEGGEEDLYAVDGLEAEEGMPVESALVVELGGAGTRREKLFNRRKGKRSSPSAQSATDSGGRSRRGGGSSRLRIQDALNDERASDRDVAGMPPVAMFSSDDGGKVPLRDRSTERGMFGRRRVERSSPEKNLARSGGEFFQGMFPKSHGEGTMSSIATAVEPVDGELGPTVVSPTSTAAPTFEEFEEMDAALLAEDSTDGISEGARARRAGWRPKAEVRDAEAQCDMEADERQVELESKLVELAEELMRRMEQMVENVPVLKASLDTELEQVEKLAHKYLVPTDAVDLIPSSLRLLELQALNHEDVDEILELTAPLSVILPESGDQPSLPTTTGSSAVVALRSSAPALPPPSTIQLNLLTPALLQHSSDLDSLTASLKSSEQWIDRLIAAFEGDERRVKGMVEELDEVAVLANETWSLRLKGIEDRIMYDEYTYSSGRREVYARVGREMGYQMLEALLTVLLFTFSISYQLLKMGRAFVSLGRTPFVRQLPPMQQTGSEADPKPHAGQDESVLAPLPPSVESGEKEEGKGDTSSGENFAVSGGAGSGPRELAAGVALESRDANPAVDGSEAVAVGSSGQNFGR